MKPELSLVVPTYNEASNISTLVRRVHQALADHCRYELIVVDDNSPDGTAEIARSLQSQYPVEVVVRHDERGLATAIAEGFKHAKGEVLGVIDADLQHPPEVTPELLKRIRDGADVAVGSRYEPGGGVENWTLQRQVISRGAIILTHALLPATRRTKDPGAGLFLVRKTVIDGVKLRPIGYKMLLEVLVRGKANHVASVPYTFRGREAGESKFNFGEQVNYMRHIVRLMPADSGIRRFVKFCVVGASGIVVNMGLLWLLTEIVGLFYLISAAISIEISIISNFILNDIWTFRDRRSSGIRAALLRGLKYNLVTAAGIGINMGILWACTELLGMYYLLSNLCGIVAATLWNFMVNVLWTWRERAIVR